MSEQAAGHAVVILAAGAAARMGTPKQLLDYRGEPMLRRAARTALQSGADEVIVVLGARHSEVQGALDGLPLGVTLNERWREGVGSSIEAGLREVERKGVATVTLALADQPLVDADILAQLLVQHRLTRAPIVAARYAGTVGVPALFAREVFADLYALPPDRGCKGVILAHADRALLVDCPEAAFDVDTPADYLAVLRDS